MSKKSMVGKIHINTHGRPCLVTDLKLVDGQTKSITIFNRRHSVNKIASRATSLKGSTAITVPLTRKELANLGVKKFGANGDRLFFTGKR